MAVGLIRQCEKCGKSYDDGKGYHPAYCDGGAALAEEAKALEEFNQLSIDERLEILYKRLTVMEKRLARIPFNGQIG